MTDPRELLKRTTVIAVVGLSADPMRPSFGVAQYMQRSGFRIIPINPNETKVLGEQAYKTLDEVPEPVDMVNIFRRPEFVPEVVEAAIRIGAKSVWMQEGVIHPAAARRAEEAGLDVVMDECLLKVHRQR